jgi:DNA-binding MurR/RpiR family transcriptional regulator
MRGKGRFFSEREIARIVALLSGTDMTIAEIAARMRCSVSAVSSVNRKKGVRNYAGARSTWENSMQTTGQRPGSA